MDQLCLSIFIFLSKLDDNVFYNISFSIKLFSFLFPLLFALFYPSTSKFSMFEWQLRRMDVFFSPILNREMGFYSRPS
jgi:hypothetical protein